MLAESRVTRVAHWQRGVLQRDKRLHCDEEHAVLITYNLQLVTCQSAHDIIDIATESARPADKACHVEQLHTAAQLHNVIMNKNPGNGFLPAATQERA